VIDAQVDRDVDETVAHPEGRETRVLVAQHDRWALIREVTCSAIARTTHVGCDSTCRRRHAVRASLDTRLTNSDQATLDERQQLPWRVDTPPHTPQ
jgi:hypothetical protein